MYTKIDKCRCCDSDKLVKYLDLGSQPLANCYHKGEELDCFPLEVNLCKDCYHSQLSIVVDPPVMFKNYLYVNTAETFKQHQYKLARDSVYRFNHKKLTVLDIACNSGDLLEYFRQMGCDIYGVDPAENLREITIKKDIPVVVDYWSDRVGKSFGKSFDIITGTNVFAHVNDIKSFLGACYNALKYEGLLILEFPYCQNMISHNEFDTVYHEHLSYFLVNSFATIVRNVGFTIVDIIQTSMHGGSIRFYCQKTQVFETTKVFELIKQEEELGLHSVDAYFEFAEKVAITKQKMVKEIDVLRQNGERVIGFGAAAKGNTALNYFGVDLDYIVDENKLKHNYLTPGRNIPIKSPDVLSQEKSGLDIVILAWNFYKEIKQKIIEKRGNKSDCCVLYVPEFKIEEIHA